MNTSLTKVDYVVYLILANFISIFKKNMVAPTSALSVAGKFIENSFEENIRLTNMQLQKMVYVANGMYLASTGGPLISEQVEVWNYGPVIRPLYNELKQFGSGYVTTNLISLYNDSIPSGNEKIKKVLDFTWRACKNADGIKLSNWSHAPDSPWTRASGEKKTIIPNEYMENYFKRFVK